MTYKIIMMGGTEIPLDADEIDGVMKAIASGSPCRCKQGIFNPSSYSCIVADKRVMEREVNEIGQYTGRYIPISLPNIFEKVDELTKLTTADQRLIG